jgi:hypothetical protein
MNMIFWYGKNRTISNNPNNCSKPVRLDNDEVSIESAKLTAKEVGFDFIYDESFSRYSQFAWIQENEIVLSFDNFG